MYGGVLCRSIITSVKDLIDALQTQKYGVINLKLEAEVEVWYVHSATITADNVNDNILYADAKHCALLKEVVMDYIVHNNKNEVLWKKYLSKKMFLEIFIKWGENVT
jgi:hypothetical protein